VRVRNTDTGKVIHRTLTVAYPPDRPRKFDRDSLKGTSDHLPVVAGLDYEEPRDLKSRHQHAGRGQSPSTKTSRLLPVAVSRKALSYTSSSCSYTVASSRANASPGESSSSDVLSG
jgi:hypothetical protein